MQADRFFQVVQFNKLFCFKNICHYFTSIQLIYLYLRE